MVVEKEIKKIIDDANSENLFGVFPKMYFYYGSPISISKQLNKTKNAGSKYPAIFLFNEFKEAGIEDPVSHFQSEVDLTFYFMSPSLLTWTEEKHIDDVIIPTHLYVNTFIELLESNTKFGDVGSVDRTTRTNWGMVFNHHNSQKSVFADNLSGLEIDLTLNIKKVYC